MVASPAGIVGEAKVASEPEALVRFLAGLTVALARMGPEAGLLSQWLHAGLTAAGYEAVLLKTQHVKAALLAVLFKTDTQLIGLGRQLIKVFSRRGVR